MKNNIIYSLGFMNYCSHDPAACLVRKSPDGHLDYIHYEEGMLSRKKKSYQFPLRAIKACLDYFDIGIEDVDIVALDYMNSKTVHNTATYYRKLIGDYLRAHMSIRPDQVYFVDSHHLAHAYTAFYPSGFESAAVLVVDGLGSEQQTHSIFDASIAGGIRHIYSQRGTGIGKLYSTITELLGFAEGEEGKTMGLAPYGANHDEQDDLLPSLRGSYQGFCVDYSNLIRRHPTSSPSFAVPKCPSKNDVYSPYYARLSYNLQKELESAMFHLSREISDRMGAKRLCIAGGVGLNCVANEIIRTSGIFEDVFVQPASGDSGIAFGLALAGVEKAEARSSVKNIRWNSFAAESVWTYAPVRFENDELCTLLDKEDVPYVKATAPLVANALAAGAIVAYYEGGWEFGPRALGHRSFLADPRSPDMKAVLNSKIKHREDYRPFAPIMMKEYFHNYFESVSDHNPHMLFAVRCKDRAKIEAPTIVHVDGTARVQTCTKESGRIYQILNEFLDRTGVPILVNTSLNDNDEPIVLSPLDALSCFLRTNADVLVVDDVFVRRIEIPDVARLLQMAEERQRLDIKERTIAALRQLMKRSDRLEEPVTFLTRNLLSSLHAKHVATEDRLIRDLFTHKSTGGIEYLVTDEFHYQVLKDIADTYKLALPSEDIQIVEDNWTSLPLIREGSYLLLYNLSVLQADDEVRRAYPALASSRSFYSSGDRRISGSRQYCGFDHVADLVTSSYETDPDRSIEEFFADIIHPNFIKNYLI
jgi:carbamoyltransferase